MATETMRKTSDMRQDSQWCQIRVLRKLNVKLSNSKNPGDELKSSLYFIKKDSSNLLTFFLFIQNIKKALFQPIELCSVI